MSSSAFSRMVSNGELRRVLPRVYRAAVTKLTFQARLISYCLWSGDGIVSHFAAGRLWGFEGMPPTPIEITRVEKCDTRSPDGSVRIHHMKLPSEDRTMIGVIPVTTRIRTLIDLSSTMEPTAFEDVLDAALSSGVVRLEWLWERVDRMPRRGRAAVPLLRRLLTERMEGRGCESPLEIRVKRLLDGMGFPPSAHQYNISDDEGFIARVDFAYPHLKVAIEVDGYGHHSRKRTWINDHRKRNRLQALKWTVIVVTVWHLGEGREQLEADIRAVLTPPQLPL
jgi:hypothetical protein